MDSNNSAEKGALSPSMITDYFRSSKSKRRGPKGKPAVKKDNPLSSVYLTPESSPGSHSNPDSVHKDNIVPENLDQSTELNVKPSNQTELTDSIGGDNSCTVSSSNDGAHHDMLESNKIDAVGYKSSTKPAALCPSAPQSPKKCIPQNKTSVGDHAESSAAVCSSKSSCPAIVAFRPYETNAASSPPCVPRLKLRKSMKSNSQADAATVAKEGETLKPKPGRRKKKDPETPKNNSVITDYFQVRRSGRQTSSEIEKEKHHQLEQMILSGCQDGLEVKEFECKGRGVVATKDFKKGDFVVEYAGDLIDLDTAKVREEKYAQDPGIGCYMYYFKCGSKQHCVDATAESEKFGRLLNHSSKGGNCCTRSLEVKGVARLILVAKRDINSGEELTYDYGDRSKASIESHPWLKL
ncbi:hypothetical protein EGW08_005345 [Elysia chlorotica]|uniref:[histone H4]-lysine(20) N-methyltransferase n=1 Tax=Elysia chlorotica TaxID=188477 RepID=A0A3S0ZVG4_ELYCH|nr:hypothetical protein EGW08_005345 [Elysia chlorotica]